MGWLEGVGSGRYPRGPSRTARGTCSRASPPLVVRPAKQLGDEASLRCGIVAAINKFHLLSAAPRPLRKAGPPVFEVARVPETRRLGTDALG